MNQLLLIVLLWGLGSAVVFAQQPKNEKRSSIEISQQATFYTVDKHYNLIKDTIYHSPANFRVFPPSKQKTFKHECKTYYLIQYPNWAVNDQKKIDDLSRETKNVEKKLNDLIEAVNSTTQAKTDSSGKVISNTQKKKFLIETTKTTTTTTKEIRSNQDTLLVSKMTSTETSTIDKTSLKKKSPIHIDLYETDNRRPSSEQYLNNRFLAIEVETFDKLEKIDYYGVGFKNFFFTSGILAIPFKVRFKIKDVPSNLTTDVSVGPYLGFTWRINHRRKYYITFPINLGLSIINLTTNGVAAYDSTALTPPVKNTPQIVPGITASTGAILQLDDFTLGVAVGWDFAPGYVKEFDYHAHTWLSFSIGHNFLAKKED